MAEIFFCMALLFISSLSYVCLELHRLYFRRVWEVHGIQAAALAVSPGNKSTRIGFVRASTHMMDCDQATLSCWEGRRWSGVNDSLYHCGVSRWWMISPRFSSALSELLDNPRDLRRSLLYSLTPGHNQGYVIPCAVYQAKYSCQTIQKAALSV